MSTQPTIHGDGPERPATPEEIANILGQYTAQDGTSYADIWANTREDDDQ